MAPRCFPGHPVGNLRTTYSSVNIKFSSPRALCSQPQRPQPVMVVRAAQSGAPSSSDTHNRAAPRGAFVQCNRPGTRHRSPRHAADRYGSYYCGKHTVDSVPAWPGPAYTTLRGIKHIPPKTSLFGALESRPTTTPRPHFYSGVFGTPMPTFLFGASGPTPPKLS